MSSLDSFFVVAVLFNLVYSGCEFESDRLVPPFPDDLCKDQRTLARIFKPIEYNLDQGPDIVDPSELFISSDGATFEDCISDDFVSEYCDDCNRQSSWSEEEPMDSAFFGFFDDLKVVPGSVEVSCVNDHTIEHSMRVSGKLAGIDSPIGYVETFQLEYGADGLITKYIEKNRFQRNVYTTFYRLMGHKKGGKNGGKGGSKMGSRDDGYRAMAIQDGTDNIDIETQGTSDDAGPLFWSMKVEAGQTNDIDQPAIPNYIVHVTNASFGPNVNKNSRSIVMVTTNSEEDTDAVPLCVLTQGETENQSLDILFNESATLTVKGDKPSTVYLSGYIQPRLAEPM